VAILNPIHGNLSGSIGGNTYLRSIYGNLVRRRTTRVGSKTQASALQRGLVANVSALWSTLSQQQRDAWDDYSRGVQRAGRFGQTVHLGGYAEFVKTNMELTHFKCAVIQSPPLLRPAGAVTAASVSVNHSVLPYTVALLATMQALTYPGTMTLQLWMTPNVSPGNAQVMRFRRYVTAAPAASSISVDIKSAYESVFGVNEASWYQLVYVRVFDSTFGVVTPWFAGAIAYAGL